MTASKPLNWWCTEREREPRWWLLLLLESGVSTHTHTHTLRQTFHAFNQGGNCTLCVCVNGIDWQWHCIARFLGVGWLKDFRPWATCHWLNVTTTYLLLGAAMIMQFDWLRLFFSFLFFSCYFTQRWNSVGCRRSREKRSRTRCATTAPKWRRSREPRRHPTVVLSTTNSRPHPTNSPTIREGNWISSLISSALIQLANFYFTLPVSPATVVIWVRTRRPVTGSHRRPSRAAVVEVVAEALEVQEEEMEATAMAPVWAEVVTAILAARRITQWTVPVGSLILNGPSSPCPTAISSRPSSPPVNTFLFHVITISFNIHQHTQLITSF